ncbi:MAG: InlB B-repeat-containing protein, partial [Clostridiales bacterium]|nr:InlB B-repeat-containing protein [Clostridiales bacterium]
MKRDLCGKLAALMLALLCAFSTTAHAATLSSLTAAQLLIWYMRSDSAAIRCEEALGLTQELVFSPQTDDDGHLTYRWYRVEGDQALPVEDGAAQGRLTVTTTQAEQRYFCVATHPDGRMKYSAPYVVRAASAGDAAQYLRVLEKLRSQAADEAAYRQLAYQLMTGPWNVLLDGTNLAEAVLRAWQQAPDDLLCRCCIHADGVDGSLLRDPHDVHQQGCPWRPGDIMPPLPEQPQRYLGKPQGRQYAAGEDLVSPGAQAVLPESGQAVVRSGLAGQCQWQVYDGAQWVSILGECSPELTITTAKLQTIFRLTGTAQLRCVDAHGQSTASFTVTPGQMAADEDSQPDPAPFISQTRSVAEGPQSTYTVVIRYVFENNEVAAEPYVATLAAGSDFSATVANPTVVGYLPYVDGAAESADSVVLSITGIQAAQTHTVVYKPTEVAYTVVHYQQNVQDDAYTEAARETRQGLTNSAVPEVARSYEGFYALLYEHPAIAADGSTVVEVYYDRAYYLMHFDLDGGYGVEPIYARYGASIGDVGTPIRAGYTFLGWTQDGVETALPATMPAQNRTYRALWAADETAQVTVVFWGENANDEDYSYLKSVPVQAKPGTDFTYDEAGVLICSLTPHTHVDACYTCDQESHTHTADCYDGVGTPSQAGLDAPSNPVNGTIARQAWTSGGKVISIGGAWYRYTGDTAIGDVAPAICGKAENNHVHTDACLSCGEVAHTHTDDCYTAGAGLDAALWRF